MPAAASHHRSFLLATSAALYPLIFGAIVIFETPDLGIGHFYFFPVAMVALAAGPVWGAAAGVAANGFYTLGIVLSPNLPVPEAWATSTSIRLVTFASMGALVGWFAHSNRELAARLRSAQERDPLTGLLNNRAFDAALSTRAALGRPFGLILADIDGLKEINAREGRAVGNDLLRRAARLLGRQLVVDDRLARVGGDEFGIITAAATADDVRALCGRLTASLFEQRVRMSFGWAIFPDDGDTALLLFRAADERLLAQKVIMSHLSGQVVDLPSERIFRAPS